MVSGIGSVAICASCIRSCLAGLSISIISVSFQPASGASSIANLVNSLAFSYLLKETGSDKLYVGDAKISDKHCIFFVNNGSAKASDIEKLINKVKKEVKSKTGVNLELEIKIIGDEK